MKKNKIRADEALVLQKLVENRSKAQALIMQGKVFKWDERQNKNVKVEKAGQAVQIEDKFEIENPFPLDVGRGALKLRAAFNFWPELKTHTEKALALDIGASTGGFTQVLLENGAQKVVALDVGRNQLHERLKSDPRVLNLEKTHILEVQESLWTDHQIQIPFDIIVSDLSFISLKNIIPKAFPWLKKGGRWLLLVKPQFELDAKKVPKGVVKKDEDRILALNKILNVVQEQSEILDYEHQECPIAGGEGNREFLLILRKKSF